MCGVGTGGSEDQSSRVENVDRPSSAPLLGSGRWELGKDLESSFEVETSLRRKGDREVEEGDSDPPKDSVQVRRGPRNCFSKSIGLLKESYKVVIYVLFRQSCRAPDSSTSTNPYPVYLSKTCVGQGTSRRTGVHSK